MADTTKRRLTCYFGILNLRGLMSMVDTYDGSLKAFSDVVTPVFSTESYTIKTTFNRNLFFKEKDEDGHPLRSSSDFGIIRGMENIEQQGYYYQKKFRRDVLWDFGDGTMVQGYNVQHTYKKPGKYRITCTFFDINRRAWVNDYYINVIVKELLPTVLKFDDSWNDDGQFVKKQIYCSKVERITRIQALNSNTVSQPLRINGVRVFSREQNQEKYEEIGKTFEENAKGPMRFMQKYWGFLENTQVLFYNSDKVHSNYLELSQNFTPRYVDIYAKFYYKQQTDSLGLSIFQVIPYKHIDDNLKTIQVLNPNAPIIYSDKQYYKKYDITQVYTEEQLPNDVYYVGRRGFCDIFYRNDFIGNENVLRFVFDIEDKNITGQLKNSVNYINTVPIGFSLRVKHNDLDYVKIGISSDGFLRDLQEDQLLSSYFVDQHLFNSMYKGIDLDIYVFPFIMYNQEFYIQGADDLLIDVYQGGVETNENMYYIPKDLVLNLKYQPIIDKTKGNSSYINYGLPDDLQDLGKLEELKNDNIEKVYNWLLRVPVVLQDYIDIKFQVKYSADSHWLYTYPRVSKFNLKETNKIVVPREKIASVDIDQLIDVYMSHPMFDEADLLKFAVKKVFGSGFLEESMTASQNFLDNTSNIKTCYLSNLISQLKMMGQDVTQFERGSFDGNNQMKNFVRLLSMNHSDLVGHVINKQFDIRVASDYIGENVGDEIQIQDTLFLSDTGKVLSVKRKGSDKVQNLKIAEGTDLIVVDRYTNISKIVSFYHLQTTVKVHSSIRIGDYENEWSWNLLLPQSFSSIKNKIDELEVKRNDGRYSLKQRTAAGQEIEKLQQRRSNLVKGYYRFFLLNPERGQNRVGNFINDSYITPEIDNNQQWDARWGITHDILMKILIENCYLKNNRKIGGVYEDGDIEIITPVEPVKESRVNKSYTLNVGGSDITYETIVNDKQTNQHIFTGQFMLVGDIKGQGSNNLLLSSGVCSCSSLMVSFQLPAKNVVIKVNADGSIVRDTISFDISDYNLNGTVNLMVGGSVSAPIFDIHLNLHIINENISTNIVFDENNIITYMRDYFMTNLKRQFSDSQTLIGGIVDNRNSSDANRRFDVSCSFKQKPKMGSNVIKLDYQYCIGKTKFNRQDGTVAESVDLNLIKNETPIQANVLIDYNGEIKFEDDIICVPINKTTTNNYAHGNLFFTLEGNAVLGTHKLRCYSYEPNNESDYGLKTILAEVGGYVLYVVRQLQGSRFMLNGETDAFYAGYKCIINSKGVVINNPVEDLQIDSLINIKVYNDIGLEVFNSDMTYQNLSDVDNNAYINQDNFLLSIQSPILNGSIGIRVDGGYYEISGFDLNLTLK